MVISYFVALPWHQKTLQDTHSNFQLVKTIAYKVVSITDQNN